MKLGICFGELLEVCDDDMDLHIWVVEGNVPIHLANGSVGTVRDFKTITGWYDYVVKRVKLDKLMYELEIWIGDEEYAEKESK